MRGPTDIGQKGRKSIIHNHGHYISVTKLKCKDQPDNDEGGLCVLANDFVGTWFRIKSLLYINGICFVIPKPLAEIRGLVTWMEATHYQLMAERVQLAE